MGWSMSLVLPGKFDNKTREVVTKELAGSSFILVCRKIYFCREEVLKGFCG